MPRKPSQCSQNLSAYEQDIINQMRAVLAATTEQERADHLRVWCSGNHDWVHTLTGEKELSAVVFILTALFEAGHPLIYENPQTLRYSLTGCLTRIMQVIIRNEDVPIPMCTECVQLDVVHIPDSEKEPALKLYTEND